MYYVGRSVGRFGGCQMRPIARSSERTCMQTCSEKAWTAAVQIEPNGLLELVRIRDIQCQVSTPSIHAKCPYQCSLLKNASMLLDSETSLGLGRLNALEQWPERRCGTAVAYPCCQHQLFLTASRHLGHSSSSWLRSGAGP